jgi:hypothetical protein
MRAIARAHGMIAPRASDDPFCRSMSDKLLVRSRACAPLHERASYLWRRNQGKCFFEVKGDPEHCNLVLNTASALPLPAAASI